MPSHESKRISSVLTSTLVVVVVVVVFIFSGDPFLLRQFFLNLLTQIVTIAIIIHPSRVFYLFLPASIIQTISFHCSCHYHHCENRLERKSRIGSSSYYHLVQVIIIWKAAQDLPSLSLSLQLHYATLLQHLRITASSSPPDCTITV